MINNRVGCFPQATVNTLLDESYLVVKSVYLKLKEVVDVAEHLETITTLAEHLEEIENVQTAADRVNRVWESIDNVDRVTESIGNVDTVAAATKEIATVAKASANVNLTAKHISNVITVSEHITNVDTVVENKEKIHAVVANLESIKAAKQNAEYAQEYAKQSLNYSKNSYNSAELAKKWAVQENTPVDGKLYSARYYAENSERVNTVNRQDLAKLLEQQKQDLSSTTTEAKNVIESTASKSKQELETIAGTYYIPYVSPGGILTWTNTGNKANPNPVDIKGTPGSIPLKGQVADRTELVKQHPIGKLNEYYQTKDTGHIWGWDFVKNLWVDYGDIRGISANELLMDPDPTEYFLSIYNTED